MMRQLIKRTFLLVIIGTMMLGTFHADDGMDSMRKQGITYYLGNQQYDSLYQVIVGDPNFSSSLIESEILDKGYMLEYVDKLKSVGKLPADYVPAGQAAPVTSAEPVKTEPEAEETPKVCEHEYLSEIVKEPTCTETGEKKYTCTKCEDTYTEEIPATGHVADKLTVIKDPSCIEAGTEEQICTVCGDILVTTEIPAIGHTIDEWEVVTEPTMLQTGEKVKMCTVCGAVLETEEIPINMTGWYIIIAIAVVLVLGTVFVIVIKRKNHNMKENKHEEM